MKQDLLAGFVCSCQPGLEKFLQAATDQFWNAAGLRQKKYKMFEKWQKYG